MDPLASRNRRDSARATLARAVLKGPAMRTQMMALLFALTTTTVACGSKASLGDIEKLKTEACACKDKACADKVEKKADSMLTDDAIKAHGDKGMNLAFGIAMCLAQARGE